MISDKENYLGLLHEFKRTNPSQAKTMWTWCVEDKDTLRIALTTGEELLYTRSRKIKCDERNKMFRDFNKCVK